MIVSGRGISRIADISDHIAAPQDLAFMKAIGITFQMRVIENRSIIVCELINRDAARVALKQFNDAAIGSGQDGRSARRDNVNRIMLTPAGARLRERIAQIFGTHARNGDEQNIFS